VISCSSLFFFSDELQKSAGMPAPQQAPQQKKQKNIITRNMGMGTAALGAVGAAAALRNPAAAGKYLGQLKDTVMRPGVALKRGLRSGSSNVAKGTPGASEAASKRVSLYKDVLRDAGEGNLQSVRALDDFASGANTIRARGFGSAGRQYSTNIFGGGSQAGKLKLSPDLKQRVDAAQKTLSEGGRVDEKTLQGLYQEVQQAGKGLNMRKGVTYYSPGERTLMMGMGLMLKQCYICFQSIMNPKPIKLVVPASLGLGLRAQSGIWSEENILIRVIGPW